MDHIRKLPDAEVTVMQAVWDSVAPVSRAQIESILLPAYPMAMTTLLTLLTRLTEKGFLTVSKDGRSNVYTPTLTRQQYVTAQSRRFFDRVCAGDISTLASALCGSGLTKEELAQLRELLQEDSL